MRNMSFRLTERQFLDGTKTVTRRLGWKSVRQGERVCAVRKSQGLKKGEKVVRLGVFRVLRAYPTRLDHISQADVIREGYPDMTPNEFVRMFCREMKCHHSEELMRIEFERIPK